MRYGANQIDHTLQRNRVTACRGRRHGLDVRFGDAEDAELAASLPMGQVRWVVSALSDVGVNCALMAALRAHGYTGQVAVAAHSETDARILKSYGAEQVFHPYKDAADYAAEVLHNNLQRSPA